MRDTWLRKIHKKQVTTKVVCSAYWQWCISIPTSICSSWLEGRIIFPVAAYSHGRNLTTSLKQIRVWNSLKVIRVWQLASLTTMICVCPVCLPVGDVVYVSSLWLEFFDLTPWKLPKRTLTPNSLFQEFLWSPGVFLDAWGGCCKGMYIGCF